MGFVTTAETTRQCIELSLLCMVLVVENNSDQIIEKRQPWFKWPSIKIVQLNPYVECKIQNPNS